MSAPLPPDDWTTTLPLHTDPVPHYARRDINAAAPPEEAARFWHWMRGQTVTLRPDGDTGVYQWDFERWVRQGRREEQASIDWD